MDNDVFLEFRKFVNSNLDKTYDSSFLLDLLNEIARLKLKCNEIDKETLKSLGFEIGNEK